MIREFVALILFISGAMLCIAGAIYATDNISIAFWAIGFILVIISVLVAFPKNREAVNGRVT